MRPIIIKYFYFWLSIYLLIFNFFLKECLEMHSSPLSHLFFSPPWEEERTRHGIPLSQPGVSSKQSQVDLHGNDADTRSHCLSFKKENRLRSCPSLLPSLPFSSSSSVFHLVWSCVLTSSVGVFLFPSLYCNSERKRTQTEEVCSIRRCSSGSLTP